MSLCLLRKELHLALENVWNGPAPLVNIIAITLGEQLKNISLLKKTSVNVGEKR